MKNPKRQLLKKTQSKITQSKKTTTEVPQKAKSAATISIFEEGDYSYFEKLVSSKSDWILKSSSDKINGCQVVVWLDKIDNKACNLTIFPKNTGLQESDPDFPISICVSRFPNQNDKPPYKLSNFGIANCHDYALNYN